MISTLQFLGRHWWSVILVAGAIAAVYLVYKNRNKYIPDEDSQP